MSTPPSSSSADAPPKTCKRKSTEDYFHILQSEYDHLMTEKDELRASLQENTELVDALRQANNNLNDRIREKIKEEREQWQEDRRAYMATAERTEASLRLQLYSAQGLVRSSEDSLHTAITQLEKTQHDLGKKAKVVTSLEQRLVFGENQVGDLEGERYRLYETNEVLGSTVKYLHQIIDLPSETESDNAGLSSSDKTDTEARSVQVEEEKKQMEGCNRALTLRISKCVLAAMTLEHKVAELEDEVLAQRKAVKEKERIIAKIAKKLGVEE